MDGPGRATKVIATLVMLMEPPPTWLENARISLKECNIVLGTRRREKQIAPLDKLKIKFAVNTNVTA